MSDDTMAWVQALVRLWDHDHQGHTMQEVGLEAGWEVKAVSEDMELAPPRWMSAGMSAIVEGLATPSWGARGKQTRLLLTPVLP